MLKKLEGDFIVLGLVTNASREVYAINIPIFVVLVFTVV